ncbi:unnamed protein product [Ascophyllum nodosum]
MRYSSFVPQGAAGYAAAGGGHHTAVTCASCEVMKPIDEFSRAQLARHGRQVCQNCLSGSGPPAAPPTRVAPAAGEGQVRCVACCQLKPTTSFGINQLRRRAGIERCMACVESDKGSLVLCTGCGKQKPFTEFSKKQIACKPGSERCKMCIENSSK